TPAVAEATADSGKPQPKVSTQTSAGAEAALCQDSTSTPGAPSGAIQRSTLASSTASRTASPRLPRSAARRQAKPMSPKLSTTRQKTVHRIGAIIEARPMPFASRRRPARRRKGTAQSFAMSEEGVEPAADSGAEAVAARHERLL